MTTLGRLLRGARRLATMPPAYTYDDRAALCRQLKASTSHSQVEEAVQSLWPLRQHREFTLAIAAFGKVRRAERALEIFEEMQKTLSPNVSSYGALLRALEHSGNWRRATEVFRGMSVQPDMSAYTSVLVVCERARRWKEATDLFEEALSLGLKPTLSSFNSALYAYERRLLEGRPIPQEDEEKSPEEEKTLITEKVLTLLRNMVLERKYTLSPREFHTAASAVLSGSGEPRHLCEVYELAWHRPASEVKESAESSPLKKKDPPGGVSSSQQHEQQHEHEHEQQQQQQERMSGPYASREMVKAPPAFALRRGVGSKLVTAARKCRKKHLMLPAMMKTESHPSFVWPVYTIHEAIAYAAPRDVFSGMNHPTIRPALDDQARALATRTFNSALATCVRSKSRADFDDLFEMLQRPDSPVDVDARSYAIATEMARRNHQYQRALDLVVEMDLKLSSSSATTKVSPAVVDAYISAAAACDEARQFDQCLDVVEKGLARTPSSLPKKKGDVVSAAAKEEDADDGVAAADADAGKDETTTPAADDEEKRDPVSSSPDGERHPATTTTTTTTSTTGPPPMSARHRVPDRRMSLYARGINASARAGWSEKAFELLGRAREEFGGDLDVSVYGAALTACGKAGDVDTAVELLEEVRAKGAKLPKFAYNAALAACAHGGAWEQALSLLATMQQDGPEPNNVSFNWTISACELAGEHDKAAALFEAALSLDLYAQLWVAAGDTVDLRAFPPNVCRTALRRILDGRDPSYYDKDNDDAEKKPLTCLLGANQYGSDLSKTITAFIDNEYANAASFRCTAFDATNGKLSIVAAEVTETPAP